MLPVARVVASAGFKRRLVFGDAEFHCAYFLAALFGSGKYGAPHDCSCASMCLVAVKL